MSGAVSSVVSLTLSDFDTVSHENAKTASPDSSLIVPDSASHAVSGSLNSCALKYRASEVFCNPTAPKNVSGNKPNPVNSGAKTNNVILPDSSNATNFSAPINVGSLQDERTRESLQKYNESFMFQFSPDKNINMKLNQQQVQINIKY